MSSTYIRDGRAPIPKDDRISRAMSAIHAKNTKPEMLVRNILNNTKLLGYRIHWKKLAGRPDIAFPKMKVAIFVHGCYWHACRYCGLPLPKTHRAFWRAKFIRNRERDLRKARELRKLGWKVLTIWEHQLKKGDDRVAERVVKKLRQAHDA